MGTSWGDNSIQRQQLPKHVLVVLTIPDLAQFAGRVVELCQPSVDLGITSRLRTTIPCSPELA
jgi:hypothetical protein